MMNWTRALHDLLANDTSLDATALTAALALDTVYMPSDLAARLLPLEGRRPSELFTRDRDQQDEDRRAPAH
jgi:hypothetical protein